MSRTSRFRIEVSDRVHLSEFRASDRVAFVELLNDRDIYDGTLQIPYPYTEDDAEAFLAVIAEATAGYGHPVHFAIRDEAERLIGGCGFERLVRGHQAEIGYWLAKSAWGRGVMTEVVAAACEHAVGAWNVVRITALVFEFNRASARVLEKNGFVCEGVLRKHHLKDGRFLDAKLYALVR